VPRVAVVTFVLASLAVIATCARDAAGPRIPRPALIAPVAGDGQAGVAGTSLPQPLVALVSDADGTPVRGVAVTWRVAAGGGSVSAPSATTDSLGRASVQMTLGTVAGANADTVLATVSQVPGAVTFTASTMPAAPAQVSTLSGDGQTGTVGQALPDSLVVVVRDAFGNASGGVLIHWTVTAGAGTLSAQSVATSPDGRAAVSWTLGTAAGTHSDSAAASVAGLAGSPVAFGAGAKAGAVSALALVAGDRQTGTVGAALGDSLVVTARDQFGNPVAGAPVGWFAASGGATSAIHVPTGADGRSAVSWTLGSGAGGQQATATLPGAAGSPVTFNAVAVPGAPSALLFMTPPGTTAAGGAIAPAVQVSVRDAFGNLLPSFADPIDLALGANPGGGALGGTTQVTPVNGTATFADLHIEKTGSGYTLVASAAVLPSVESPSFSITPAGGPRLAFTVQPGNANAGAAFAPAVQVSARDSLGNPFTSFTGDITVALGANPANGTLGGTSTAAAVLGVATFADLTLDHSGAGYTLTASAPSAATAGSAAFDVAPGPASRLTFTVQPTSAFQGSAIVPAVVVTARDAYGNGASAFTGPVAIAIAIGTNPSNGSLSGTLSRTAVAGVATFNDLAIDSAGAGYTLAATASGLTPATSAPFQVVHVDVFARLKFTAQPTDVTAGSAIAPVVSVTAVDQLGNPAAGFTGSVIIALAANPAGGTLGGTLSAPAVSGVATFADLRLDKRGTGYRLWATSAGLAPDTSASFAVGAGPPARIAVLGGDGQIGAAGTVLPAPYSVRAEDQFGNPVSGATVAWAISSGGGGVNPVQSVTDSLGDAAAIRTLGAHAGIQSVAATLAGLADSVAAFTATATPNGTINGTISLGTGFLAPPAGASSTASNPTAAPAYTSGDLIVTYRSAALAAPPIGSAGLAAPATAAALGRTIHDRLAATPAAAHFDVHGVSPALLAARVRVRDTTQLDALAATLRQDPAVLSVERDVLVRLETHRSAAGAVTLPGDPLYPRQAWHYGMLDLPRAWAITTGRAGVLVAVVDNGIRYDHPAVAANLTHDGYDFVSSSSVKLCSGGSTIDNAGDGDGYDADPTMTADYDFNVSKNCAIGLTTSGNHGLHVAGTIGAAGNDGVGVTGVNWTVRIRPVRVIGVAGFGSFYDIAQGILYAAGLPADNGSGGTVTAPSGARIINLSLGGSSGSSALHNAVIAATNAGALVVAAAGNSGNTSLLYPAAYPEALSVSAVGPDGLLASYSSYGSTIDIAAPGGDIADGDGSFGVLSSAWNFVTNAPIYDSWDGTSMATPHVSGVAALLLARDPSLTGAQLRARLTSYAVDAGAPGPDNQYGAGIVNARNSLTQTLAPPAQPYARLYSSSGLLLGTTAVAADGSYAFTGLGDGGYLVFGGADESGDGQLGIPGRPWGALGGSVTPSTVTVDGAGTYPATFSVMLPLEQEPNGTPAQANALVVGGWVSGTIGSASDVDDFRVRIAQSGIYTFETSAVSGACGFALEEDTRLTVADSSGSVLATNDDIDAAALNLCSRVTATLGPGSYVVAVQGTRAKRYRLAARLGS
jgi:subtilisin family serine protease